MMIKTHRSKSIAVAAIAAWALVACGGSGSGSASNGNAQSTGFSGQDASAPIVANNIPTDGFNWINYRRKQAGVGVLAHNNMQ